MKPTSRISVTWLSLCISLVMADLVCGEIIVEELTHEEAAQRYGITMHARKNGDAGIQIWLRFKQEGKLKHFTYAELRMTDERGQHLVSARLQPHPVHDRQPDDVTTVAFSADPDQSVRCSFLVVCYGGEAGGVGYSLHVRDFLDPKKPVSED